MVTMGFKSAGIFVWGLNYALPEMSRDLNQWKEEGLLCGNAAVLTQIGYRRSLIFTAKETYLELASKVVRNSISAAGQTPQALFFQHANYESATEPWDAAEPDAAARYSYFAPVLLRHIGMDHLPYMSLFESGCAGFSLLLSGAGGLLLSSRRSDPVICMMGDRKPNGAHVNLHRERILASDHASSFVVGKEAAGYQLLGIACYSTARIVVPLLELVKRTVQMITTLGKELSIEISRPDVLVHYPNIFPDAWKMVTRSLRHRDEQLVMLDFEERAHCGGSDTVISLSRVHEGQEGRLHVAVNYGAGVHLAVAILQEQERAA